MRKLYYKDHNLMGFEDALKALKNNLLVARLGWNGKEMFLYMVPKASYPAMTDNAKRWFGANAMVDYEGYIAMKNAQNSICIWTPSQVDLLADDWCIVNMED